LSIIKENWNNFNQDKRKNKLNALDNEIKQLLINVEKKCQSLQAGKVTHYKLGRFKDRVYLD